MQKKLCFLVLGVGLLALPRAALADTYAYSLEPYYGNENTYANGWKSRTSAEQPTNGTECLASGTVFQQDDLPYGNVIFITDLTAPFSGSAHQQGYITLCKDSAFVVLRVNIDMSGCFGWSCSMRFSHQVTSYANLTVNHSQYMGEIERGAWKESGYRIKLVINPN